ncbi:uncharacterized protein LOC131949402 isoform X2 [Physella acuta]|uniref:uncharacterized protein LOC131949402 isoform X2 n=1 Tax=Physella acuta TaxID=109671 RepID=UPI0027DC94DB|nr:uncharacterized protein LOC131949402 isoform X2 [Physella acuta]
MHLMAENLMDCISVEDARVYNLRDKLKSALHWKIIEPFLPPWPRVTTGSATSDQIVGLTLHCFILSSFVLTVALAKVTYHLIRFLAFVTLNFVVFRGDVKPIVEEVNEAVTQDQLRDATIFDCSGLRVIIVQKRLSKPNPSSLTTTTQPDYTGSDSSQDIFSISSL